ncbi:MAG TPA: hypothetical protein VNT22_07995 [Baekduia sp.]|nr:hypothetical protein [Baekduia sp.]
MSTEVVSKSIKQKSQGRIFHRFAPRGVEPASTSTNPELKVERALEVFNASEHTQTVAGVARTLGTPNVSANPDGKGSIVAIVISWDISWYRYEVDLSNECAGARLERRGYDQADLDDREQRDNVAADEWGQLHLVGAVA